MSIFDALSKYAESGPPEPRGEGFPSTSKPGFLRNNPQIVRIYDLNLPSGGTTPLDATTPGGPSEVPSGTVTPGQATEGAGGGGHIPPFFKKKPDPNGLACMINRAALRRALSSREAEVLTRDEVYLLEAALQVKGRDSFGRINYDQFKEVMKELSDLSFPSAAADGTVLEPSVGEETMRKLEHYLCALVFTRFCKDPLGRVAVDRLVEYAERRAAALRARIALARLDSDGDGCLTEEELRAYVEGILQDIPQLKEVPPRAAVPLCGMCNLRGCRFSDRTYLDVALRKLLFFHGARGVGPSRRIRIRDLVAGPAWAELQAVLRPQGGREVDEDSMPDPGWFSPLRAHALFRIFRALDFDQDGLISQEEFCRFSPFFPDEETLQGPSAPRTLSRLFVARLFQEQVSKQPSSRSLPSAPGGGGAGPGLGGAGGMPGLGGVRGRQPGAGGGLMNFQGFLDFCVAWDNRNSEPGLRFFFPLFDLERRGAVSAFDVYACLKDLYVLWQGYGYQELKLEEVVGEIFDMVKPADPSRITLKDLVSCRLGGVFVMMLADVMGFHQYENREQ